MQIRRSTLVVALVTFLLGVGAALAGAVVAISQSEPATVVSPSDSSGTQVVQLELGPDTNATQPKSGINADKMADAFQCRPSFVPVQVPVGTTKQANGATFILSKPEGFPAVQTLSIKLSPKVGVPTLIVTPVAHIQAPDLYPQRTLQVDIKPGGTGTYVLNAKAFAENYTNDGIADVTLCTKVQ